MLEFFVGVVTGLSAAALIWIVFGPFRRGRGDGPLDRDVESSLLLGLDPVEGAAEAASAAATSGETPEHPRPYDTAQLQALRRLAREPRRSG